MRYEAVGDHFQSGLQLDIMKNLKQQLAEHRAQLRQFKEQERSIRDFLLLCTPQSTVAYHAGAAAEILKWQASGQFESQGREYPFRPKLLQAALAKMWEEAAFVPESSSNPERPLRYLKKIMVRLLEQQAQNQKAAGVQINTPLPPSRRECAGTGQATPPCPPQGETPPNPPQGGNGMEQALTLAWCKHTIDGLHKVIGLDVRHIIQRVEEVQTKPETFHDDLPPAIEEMLLLEARESLGESGLKHLQQEIELWFAPHKGEWEQTIFANTVAEALRERLRERFRLPRLA